MYALHRLTKNSQNFVFSFNGTARARGNAVSLAIAAVLVHSIDLSSTINQGEYFTIERKAFITSKLNDLNELLRIDVDKIFEYAHKLQSYRRTLVIGLGAPTPMHVGGQAAVLDFFGISRFMSKEDIELIGAEGPQIASDMVKFHDLMTDLNCLGPVLNGSGATGPVA